MASGKLKRSAKASTKVKRSNQNMRTARNQIKRYEGLVEERPQHEHVARWKEKANMYRGK